MVVIHLPLPSQPRSGRQTLEQLECQKLVAESAVETLGGPSFQWLPGSMYNAPTSTCFNQRRIAWATNSGPLSERTHFGTLRIANSSASVSIRSSLVMLRSTFKAMHSRVFSSTIESHLSWLPLVV